MKILKTILPLCLVGVMAPTVAIVATSCGCSSSTTTDINTSPNKDESFSFNNGKEYSITWNNVYQSSALSALDPLYPTPRDYAKKILNDFDFEYTSVKNQISSSDDKTVLSSIINAQIIDANVLAFMIIMDTYQFVWSLHYNQLSASSFYDSNKLWPGISEYSINSEQINQVTLQINKITSHYTEDSGYKYDVDYTISNNTGNEILNSVIYSGQNSSFWGFTLTYGHATGEGTTLSVEDPKDVIEWYQINFNILRFSEGFTVQKPDESGENPDIYRFLTNTCGHDVGKDSSNPYLGACDLVNIIYPNIEI